MSAKPGLDDETPAHYSTIETARRLGLAVRSVQLMVDRGELDAWKTPGGHRRIACRSVERWLARHRPGLDASVSPGLLGRTSGAATLPTVIDRPVSLKVLLITADRQCLDTVRQVLSHAFPGLELHAAEDGIAGLALHGAVQPDVLIVDLPLPGIDAAALLDSLRTQPAFAKSRLIVSSSREAGAQSTGDAAAMSALSMLTRARLATDLAPAIRAALASLGADAVPA